ncbi:UDP-4-amino-4,6-dideoxy-N-acetyl-beta-L-altrosamine N-acetyltransferase [Lysinibacillus fusiformis]|uniref:UDP-4-amino-4, 6-dideoxy-N-acetyl-beta-L-altrosamine N-acetyltransferase n=1 Tax=Lysinibacillus fusiformis TaxID=28031 RepID=UPI00148E03D8|nr:UDP-4-amino-4,6-dideoxy-N-acetyl-beta-L-altrosamine N-acetyltransferase [Lysinibacillus fusiformis]NOG29155.1 UDP-4-amino-4,6-dideoxy-N-acetyl-beta-L-altrosamine N-acetyltransferase [Lysinibacillus fusiformis]
MKWITIEEEHLQQILDWRTSEEITRFMYTDIEYSLENQKKWLNTIRADQNGYYWLMEYRGDIIGYISITEIDWKHKRGAWNFYIGNMKYAMLAGFLGAYMYNYAFTELGLEKLIGEVMGSNEGVQKLHLKQGASKVGVYERHICKNGEWHDVHVFEMTKALWQRVGNKFKKYIPEVRA